MRRTETIDILVVGGGASGLSAAGALKRRGYHAVALEQDERIGGTWARRYERLHLHTLRRFSGLAHFGIPRDFPRYVPTKRYAQYLERYVQELDLDVRLGERVERIAQANGGWCVETTRCSWVARAVVLATGRYREPVTPVWPGRDAFPGRVLHSVEYRSGRDFAGERVLVVGMGNTGAEIATDLAEQGAAFVAIAVRTRPPIMPRELFRVVPAQVLGLLLTPLPIPRLLDRAGALLRRIGTGDLRPYGLGREAWGPFTARRPAVIDVGFLGELKAGRIHVRPGVERLTATGVVFADGCEEHFDAIIAATGFRTALGDILDLPEAIAADGRPRFRSGQSTPYSGLYFIGYDETTRGVLFEANRDSRRLARSVATYLGKDDVSTTVAEPAKFLVVGAAGYVVNLGFFAALYAVHVPYVPASILSYFLSNALMYLGNRYFTFRLGHEGFWATYLRYLVVGAAVAGLNAGLLALIVELLHVDPRVGQAISLLLVTPIAFVLFKRWTFKLG